MRWAASRPISFATSGATAGERVVVVRLDPHDARVGSAARKPTGNTVPSDDRHLAEDVARVALADDPLDPVDDLDRLDAPLEHGEQRALVALVRGVLARGRALMSAAARESCSRSAGPSDPNTATAAISSAVTMAWACDCRSCACRSGA